MENAYRSRFLREQSQKTRMYGLITTAVALLAIPVFYYIDVYELQLSGTLPWRLLGLSGVALYLISLLFKLKPRQRILAHTASLSIYLLMMLGLALDILQSPAYKLDHGFAVTTGVLTVWLVIVMVSRGERIYLMWTGIALALFFGSMLLLGPVQDIGFPITILLISGFAAFTLYSQHRQELQKSIYLYQLEEKEERIARQREELATVNANLNSFNYAITHDLKAPLRRAQSFAQLIERRLGKMGLYDKDTKEFMAHIHHDHQKLFEIIDGLTLLNQLGVARPSPTWADVQQLTAQIWEELKEEGARQAHANIEYSQAGPVFADAKLIWHVLHNLLANAIKYSALETAPCIQVSTYDEAQERILKVQDNGAGFPAAMAAELGHPFKRLHAASEFEGSGIGLAIVRCVVELHRGRFWAEGEEGKGAAFYCSFPMPDQGAS